MAALVVGISIKLFFYWKGFYCSDMQSVPLTSPFNHCVQSVKYAYKKKKKNQHILTKATHRLDYSDQATLQALTVPGPTSQHSLSVWPM